MQYCTVYYKIRPPSFAAKVHVIVRTSVIVYTMQVCKDACSCITTECSLNFIGDCLISALPAKIIMTYIKQLLIT